MSQPTQTCELCGQSVTVTPYGRGFPPDVAKRKLKKLCAETGCKSKPSYLAGVTLGGPIVGLPGRADDSTTRKSVELVPSEDGGPMTANEEDADAIDRVAKFCALWATRPDVPEIIYGYEDHWLTSVDLLTLIAEIRRLRTSIGPDSERIRELEAENERLRGVVEEATAMLAVPMPECARCGYQPPTIAQGGTDA